MNYLNKYFKENVSSKEIFLAQETQMFFQYLSDMVTERFTEKVKVNIVWDEPNKTACTDNISITLNANCNIFDGLSNEKRMLGCIGFLSHELGHILYSDFTLRNKIISTLKKGIIPSLVEGYFSQSMKECFERDINSSLELLCKVENYMEDKFIEYSISQFYAGSFKSGILQNDMVIKNGYIRRKEKDVDVTPELLFALQVRNYEFEEKDLLENYFISHTQIPVDKILSLTTYKERYLNAITCASILWDDMWEENSQKQQNKESKTEKGDGENSTDLNSKGDYRKFSRSKKPLVEDVSADVSHEPCDLENDISDLIKNILNKEVNQKIKDETAVDEAQAIIDMNQIGKGKLEIKRLSPCDNQCDVSDLKRISKTLQKRVLKTVLQREKGMKKTGLSVGRRIDCNAVARGSVKQFSKTEFPNNKPILSICVVVDASGSMAAKRIEIAKKALFVLEDFCNSLHVPLLAYAHNYSRKTHVYKVRDFTSKRVKTKSLSFSIESNGGNKDGEAIEYGVLKLKNRKEKHKLLIIVSDGKPSAYSNFKEGNNDIQRVLLLAKKHNIITIPVAIGDDIKDLTTIYGNGLVDARNLDNLPVELTKLLVKYLK